MKYLFAVVLFGIALGTWSFALGLYYAHDWGGTPAQVCSRTGC